MEVQNLSNIQDQTLIILCKINIVYLMKRKPMAVTCKEKFQNEDVITEVCESESNLRSEVQKFITYIVINFISV